MPDATDAAARGTALDFPAAAGEGRARRYAKNAAAAALAAAVLAGLVWFLDKPAEAATSQSVTLTARPAGPPPRIGNPAPDVEVVDLDGNIRHLSDFAGQPVWLSFWASWCPPCRSENADIQAAHEQFRDAGLVVLAVNVGEDPETVGRYVERAGLDFVVGLDPRTEAAATYRITGLPSHYFIDADGVLRDWRIGSMDKSGMERKIRAILPR